MKFPIDALRAVLDYLWEDEEDRTLSRRSLLRSHLSGASEVEGLAGIQVIPG